VGIEALERKGQLTKETIVTAGNELSVAGHTMTITSAPAGEVARRLAWAGIYQKDGWLAFRGETLEKVVAELNRHNRRQLKIGDPETARLRVGGQFRMTDLDGFVAALEITHRVQATLSGPEGQPGDVIVLTRGTSESDSIDELIDPPADQRSAEDVVEAGVEH
jgi:transmembrane sensor